MNFLKSILTAVFVLSIFNAFSQKQLVKNSGFENDTESWGIYNEAFKISDFVKKSGKSGMAITAPNNTDWLGMDQTVSLPKNTEAIDFSAWVQGMNIAQGKDNWNTGVIIIEFLNNKEKVGESINIANLLGTFDWKKVTEQLPVPEGANAFRIMIAMSGNSGFMYVDDVEARAMKLSDIPGMESKNPLVAKKTDAAPTAIEQKTKTILVDKNATNATAALFYNLKKLAETNILFGHQESTKQGVVDSLTEWSNQQQNKRISRYRSDVQTVTGSFPAVYGFDFSRITDYEKGNAWYTYEQQITRELAIDAFKRGGVVTFCWHYGNPVTGKSFYWNDSPVEAVSQILPGGSHNQKYLDALKEIADFNKTLVNADGTWIPVIFRPFHEMNGDWFWWGKAHCTPQQYKDLFQYTVKYLRDTLGVRNFLYAWSPDILFSNEAEYLERYPGDDFVDVVGIDDYEDMKPQYPVSYAATKFKIVSDYALKHNKIAALTETGLQNISQSDWFTEKLMKTLTENKLQFAYVLLWANTKDAFWTPYKGHSSEADFIKFINNPYIINGNKIPEMYKTQ